MKKIFSLLLILIVVAGCNKEKVYKENLNGTWTVYKYLRNNTDKTAQFIIDNPAYSISFTEAGAFSELVTNPDSTYTNGTFRFEDNLTKIVLENTFSTFVIDTAGDTTFIPKTIKRPYTIFNLTRDHVQLRNDTSQLYMNKKQ